MANSLAVAQSKSECTVAWPQITEETLSGYLVFETWQHYSHTCHTCACFSGHLLTPGSVLEAQGWSLGGELVGFRSDILSVASSRVSGLDRGMRLHLLCCSGVHNWLYNHIE